MINIVKDNLAELRNICRQYHVKSLYLIGSATDSSRFDGDSDIDLLYRFAKNEIPEMEYADNYFSLLFALQNFFNRRVDLVAEEKINNPYFLNSIKNHPEVRKYLFDIANAIKIIEAHLYETSGLSLYKESLKTKDAVERRLAIIGEALNKACKIDSALTVTNKTKIIGLRHILVHDYALVEDETIWVVCKAYLPLLYTEISVLLEEVA